ncbi:enoyl-CoA hydratase-related protein, partial [Rhizobium johnstonii]
MSEPAILLDETGGIARITLNRPDRLNSFTAAMHAELRDALDRAAASARVIVI